MSKSSVPDSPSGGLNTVSHKIKRLLLFMLKKLHLKFIQTWFKVRGQWEVPVKFI